VQEASFSSIDILPLLTPGVNTLYMNDVNFGGPAALQFSAVITTTE